jgi:hypothetical protein
MTDRIAALELSNRELIGLLEEARAKAAKFVQKVLDGRAVSKETYMDMVGLMEHIDAHLKGGKE